MLISNYSESEQDQSPQHIKEDPKAQPFLPKYCHQGGNSRQTSDSAPKNKHSYFHPKEGKLTADKAPKSKQTAATGSPKSKQTDFKDTEYQAYQAHRHDQYPTRSACNSSNFRPAYNPRNVAMRSFYDQGQRGFQSK